MKSQSVSMLLQKINQDPESSIVGCQIVYRETLGGFIRTQDLLEREQAKLQTIEEMTNEYRTKLRNWRVAPDCTRHRPACRSGRCGCSYGDLVCFASLLGVSRHQRRTVRELQHQLDSYRYLADRIIFMQFRSLCQESSSVQAFVAMACAVGDITSEELDLVAITPHPWLDGSPYELRLTVGPHEPYVMCWNIFSERIS